ncbi:S-adenosyl-L-methionine-dependent methyltransferase [Lyophyllum atratum]|nr:S-adenosyl-L-methionine-dependent methyltransferase [Lyophyllum atratum]
MTSPIHQLLRLITDSIAKLDAVSAASGCPLPDLYTPFSPSSEAFRADPEVSQATAIISAAALQLDAILAPPQVTLCRVVGGHLKSAALRICLESNVTEILREAGPQGLHVDEIASKNGQDPRKLARFLRILATQHIYHEVQPDVFANTRISSLMDTLKPSQEVIDCPEIKCDNTLGFTALLSHNLDEVFKGSAYAWETLCDPVTAKSGDPEAAPVVKALNREGTLWDLYSQDEHRGRRFNVAMQGVHSLEKADSVLGAFNWKDLLNESVVVDVGGGVGATSLVLAQELPHLKLVVQDLPKVIENAEQFWKKSMPNSKVTLEVQDFFTPQSEPRSVSVFMLKQILHDWSDEYCVKILTQLRAAAGPATKLLLIENLIQYGCHDTSGDDKNGIPGSVPHEAPAPLLANYGAVNELAYHADLCMFILCNSQERTVRHFDKLLLSTGWKMQLIRRQQGGGDKRLFQAVEAVPIEVPSL